MKNTVRMSSLPSCDLYIKPTPASVDGKTVMGPWAYMCSGHFQTHGVGLGAGKGQRIVLMKGVPQHA